MVVALYDREVGHRLVVGDVQCDKGYLGSTAFLFGLMTDVFAEQAEIYRCNSGCKALMTSSPGARRTRSTTQCEEDPEIDQTFFARNDESYLTLRRKHALVSADTQHCTVIITSGAA